MQLANIVVGWLGSVGSETAGSCQLSHCSGRPGPAGLVIFWVVEPGRHIETEE